MVCCRQSDDGEGGIAEVMSLAWIGDAGGGARARCRGCEAVTGFWEWSFAAHDPGAGALGGAGAARATCGIFEA